MSLSRDLWPQQWHPLHYCCFYFQGKPEKICEKSVLLGRIYKKILGIQFLLISYSSRAVVLRFFYKIMFLKIQGESGQWFLGRRGCSSREECRVRCGKLCDYELCISTWTSGLKELNYFRSVFRWSERLFLSKYPQPWYILRVLNFPTHLNVVAIFLCGLFEDIFELLKDTIER
jgi:hypothetical protein